MAIDPQTLFDEAKCFSCFGSLTAEQMLELALLARIAGSGGGGGGGATTRITEDGQIRITEDGQTRIIE